MHGNNSVFAEGKLNDVLTSEIERLGCVIWRVAL